VEIECWGGKGVHYLGSIQVGEERKTKRKPGGRWGGTPKKHLTTGQKYGTHFKGPAKTKGDRGQIFEGMFGQGPGRGKENKSFSWALDMKFQRKRKRIRSPHGRTENHSR